MANVHPIVRQLKKLDTKIERRILFAQRLVVADIYLNKKSRKKVVKLIA